MSILASLRCGDVENRVEMTARIAVDPRRVDAADDAGAFVERRFHQFGRARLDQHAELRECDDFEADGVFRLFPRLQHAMQIVELVFGRNVDMAADMGRAVDHALAHQIAGALRDRPGQGAADLHFIVDHGAQRLRHVDAVPRQAPEDLVEMHMRFDERRDARWHRCRQ